jgi:hypothetical protein
LNAYTQDIEVLMLQCQQKNACTGVKGQWPCSAQRVADEGKSIAGIVMADCPEYVDPYSTRYRAIVEYGRNRKNY